MTYTVNLNFLSCGKNIYVYSSKQWFEKILKPLSSIGSSMFCPVPFKLILWVNSQKYDEF